MLKNYLKVAWQNLLAKKMYSVINVFGLAIGFACCLLISLFVVDELAYEREFVDAERIYRISRNFFTGTSFESREATNAPQVAPLLKENFPEVEQATRFVKVPALVGHGNDVFYENNFIFADDAFFDVFKLEWLHGEPRGALADLHTVVLTESLARKYFGDQIPLGQTLTIERDYPLRVTGVVRDLPDRTHLVGDAFVSLRSVEPIFGVEYALDAWGNNNFHTYVRLRRGADIGALERGFPAFRDQHMEEDSANPVSTMIAIRLGDIHLHSVQDYELTPPGSIVQVLAFAAIALLIVLIACINFMNLSTARYSARALEVGLRKSLGAGKAQLVSQFLAESMLVAVLALLVALALVELLLPAFSAFVGKDLDMGYAANPYLLLELLGFALFVGLLAGSYPAFFLSAFQPARVLKGDYSRGTTGVLFRNLLVIMQFTIAIVLLIATTVAYLQMKLAEDAARSFSDDRMVILSGSDREGLGSQWQAMKQQLARHPGIRSATASDQTPLDSLDKAGPLRLSVDDPERFNIHRVYVDDDFFETYGIEFLAGRPFDENRADVIQDSGPTGGYILNESAVREFGWEPEDALGRTIEFLFRPGFVIGVVEDSYFESLRNTVKPLLFSLPRENDPNLRMIASIRLTGNNLADTLAFIDSTWRGFMPEYPVQRRFLYEDFTALYQSEQRQGDLFSYFSLLAVVISCFGLFGLASFIAERRSREISIRKVMGGSVMRIIVLLTNDFSKLVLLANVIAWPVAYFAMSQWLENFAYRIDLTSLIFVGSGLAALCIAWATVGATAAKAASARPVLALRYQ